MEKKVTITCETRRFAEDDKVQTSLTLDFTNLSDEDILQYAIDAATIKWQGAQRRKKEGAIPTSDVYVVPKPGTRATGEVSLDKAFEKVVKAFDGDIDKAIEFIRAKANNRA